MDFKTTKHELERVFEQIKSKAEEASLPLEEDVHLFVRLSRRMHQLAAESWVDEAEDFSHLATQLHNAVRKGDVEDSILLVDSLQDAQAYCHRMFKE